ncbi:hypothetical protein GCM10017673_16700 [Streptosporangium violaceochromogenes]|nr:hypothetical protein GCM10017673_16700 [Streptosporangium violaceochromogenes]
MYVSPAAPRGGGTPEGTAARLRALPGITDVRVRPGGLLEIVVAVPGELVTELDPDAAPDTSIAPRVPDVPGGRPAEGVSPWADFPRVWRNPGFVVRYAHCRAVAVRRWAAELGVGGVFRPELLDGRADRAVLRVLAEAGSRRRSGEPGWAAYAERLALAYHDAFEHAPALPAGDEDPAPLHTARVRLAGAVREVLAGTLAALGETPPDRL